LGAWGKNLENDTRRIQCILRLVFIAAHCDIGVLILSRLKHGRFRCQPQRF
jgi:hypothetical protein